MALPPAHSWGWLRFMLNEHPVLKNTRDGIQRLPEAVERLPLVWQAHVPPTDHPPSGQEQLQCSGEKTNSFGGAQGAPWEQKRLPHAYLPPALPCGMLRKSSLLCASLTGQPSQLLPHAQAAAPEKGFLGHCTEHPSSFQTKICRGRSWKQPCSCLPFASCHAV